MIAYGLQKTSLVNYPGKLCTVIFTGGCNLRCKYCYNKDLVDNPNPENHDTFDEDYILSFLLKRKKLVEAITITGGEPTINKDLPDFLGKIRKLDFLSIKLDTNGFNPEMVKECLDGSLIDYAAIDIKTSPSKYPSLTGTDLDFQKIIESVNILKASGIPFELRTTAIPGYLSLEDIKEIGAALGDVPLFHLQQFVNENTLDPEFSSVHSFSKEELKAFEIALQKFAKSTSIKGI